MRATAAVLRNVHFPGRFAAFRLAASVLGENPGKFVVPLSGGGKLLVDGVVDSRFFFMGDHDWNVQRFLSRSLNPGSVFFDVGANIGGYTIPMALRVGERGHVYAFEAFKPNYEMLLQSIALNKLTNVTAVFAAVAGSSGTLDVPDVPRGGSIGNYSLATESPNRVAIPSWSLDEFASKNKVKRVDVLKIDIEGSETMAFRGARSLFVEGQIGTTIFEVNPYWLKRMGSSVDELWGIVESLGARPFLLTRFARLKPIENDRILHSLSDADSSSKLDVVLKHKTSQR